MKNNRKSTSGFILLLPVFLMVLIFLNQLLLVSRDNLLNWNGGGFGMFSTIGSRYFKVFLEVEGREYPVTFPRDVLEGDFHLDIAKFRNHPSDKNLNELSQAIQKVTWVKKDNEIFPYEEDIPFEKEVEVKAAKVQLWGMTFKTKHSKLTSFLIKEAVAR